MSIGGAFNIIGVGPQGLYKSKPGGPVIDAQALAHYNRVIADGGQVPSGLSGVNAFFTTIKTIYATSDITTAISVGLDAQVLGYKLGAGAGTTLGQAAQKLYSCSGASGDVVQTTAASQPLLLVHEGANYWWGSGVQNNFVSTPNAAANQITGDIEIIAKIDYKNNSDFQYFVLKGSGINVSYAIAISPTDRIYIDLKVGAIVYSQLSTVSISSSFNGFLKFTRLSSNGNIEFFTSTDGVTYTKLGATITSVPSGSITTNTESLLVGGTTSASFNFRSKISRLTISNSIGGAPVVDFNPNQYNAATSQTQWTSTTGEVWTINTGTATTGYKGVLVNRTRTQGDGVNDKLSTSTLTLNQPFVVYAAANRLTPSNGLSYLFDTGVAKNIIYSNPTTAFGGLLVAFSPDRLNQLALFKVVFNSTNSAIGINNLTEQTGINLGTNNGTSFNLFSISTGGNYSNAIINTIVNSNAADNATTRLAMYNYIRSLNNNAF
jgi:hypothetical protein